MFQEIKIIEEYQQKALLKSQALYQITNAYNLMVVFFFETLGASIGTKFALMYVHMFMNKHKSKYLETQILKPLDPLYR